MYVNKTGGCNKIACVWGKYNDINLLAGCDDVKYIQDWSYINNNKTNAIY